MSAVHRVRLPVGASVLVDAGHRVEPAEVLATWRPPGAGVTIQVAAPLHRSATDAADALEVTPGSVLEADGVLARHGTREVRVREACLFLAYDADDGSALVAPLVATQPVLGHVRGEVASVSPEAVEIRVDGALVTGIAGSGAAVHGELRVAVHEPGEELRAGAIDVGATGRILVGGSRASAETLTRARAMGVAGIVLAGALDKELRDFQAAQRRRRQIGAPRGTFALLLLEGYGKTSFDPSLFAWFRRHDGRMASLFGDGARLYVYDAAAAPGRRALPRPGDRVIAHRRPSAGQTGVLVRELPAAYSSASGVAARSGLVRFDDSRTAVVPIANLEAAEPPPEG